MIYYVCHPSHTYTCAVVLLWYGDSLKPVFRLVPYGVLTDATATVIAAGLISNASQLESLLEIAQITEPEAKNEFHNQFLQKKVSSGGTATH